MFILFNVIYTFVISLISFIRNDEIKMFNQEYVIPAAQTGKYTENVKTTSI